MLRLELKKHKSDIMHQLRCNNLRLQVNRVKIGNTVFVLLTGAVKFLMILKRQSGRKLPANNSLLPDAIPFTCQNVHLLRFFFGEARDSPVYAGLIMASS